ncbi:hypothetical protein EAP59_23210 [Salmonella enterica]|nr:hypothetical protein [Salmonella enterica]
MRGWRSAKVSTIREEFDEINDSMKVSSSRMKNKVGAQKGAFIKMKQENIYIYQRECAECYVPIIAPLTTRVHAMFTSSEKAPCAIFVPFPARNESICMACCVR